MAHRKKASNKGFSRTAAKTKDINIRPKIMRGGIRL